jgi:hypothetical protein
VVKQEELYALHLLRLAFAHYPEDIVDCVTRGVKAEGDLSRHRREALKEWRKLAIPGTFHFDSPAMRHLMISVCGFNPAQLSQNLPPQQNVKLSHHELAQTIYQVVDPTLRNRTVRAPFIAQGTFQFILHQIVNQLHLDFAEIQGNSFKPWLIAKIQQVLRAYKYNVIPWSPQNSRQRTAVWNQWAFVNVLSQAEDEDIDQVVQPSVDAAVDAAIAQAVRVHQESDPTKAWSPFDIQIGDLKRIMERGTPPIWDQPSKQQNTSDGPNYVQETITWASRPGFFNVNRPTHYLALVIGVIFSKMSPFIGYDKDEVSTVFKGKPNALHARNKVQHIAWTESKRISHRDAGKVATAFIVSIMAITDGNSPLRKHMAPGGGSVGLPWSNAMGNLLFSCFGSSLCI